MMRSFDAEAPLSCMSGSKDCSLIAVAGGTVFKVYSNDDRGFAEKCNLKVGNKNMYGAADVAWNAVTDNILASAATNGTVIIWNLNKQGRNKQEIVYPDHKRAVNRISFHSSDSNLLLSGAQGGQMKLFDLRRKSAANTFYSEESVRDIQFNPNMQHSFAAGFDNGTIQIWDIRNQGRWEREFQAHSGPVFCLDYHPDEKGWLATSGRDKLIKVWESSGYSRYNCVHSVSAITPIARIRWRPQRRFHIGSCGLMVDFNVSVWDVRRPYVPFASFPGHKDILTGFLWKRGTPHCLLSCSKDHMVIEHKFDEAERPAEQANPVAVAINNTTGSVMHTTNEIMGAFPGAPATPTRHSSHIPLTSVFHRRPDRSEKFLMVSSHMTEFTALDEDLCFSWFVTCAKEFDIGSQSLPSACDHNSRVAESLGRQEISLVWQLLKAMFSDYVEPLAVTHSPTSGKNETHNVTGKTGNKEADTQGTKTSSDASKAANNDGQDSSSGMSDSDQDHDDTETDELKLSQIASGWRHNSFGDYFNDEPELSAFDEHLGNMVMQTDWTLPKEAFQVRKDLHELVSENNAATNANSESPNNAGAPEAESGTETSKTCEFQPIIHQEILSCPPFTDSIPDLDLAPHAVETMQFYADKGDVQMSVTMLLVLGDHVRPHVDDMMEEQWLTGYIDLLCKFELYTVAAAVIKACRHPAVMTLSQQTTFYKSGCSGCGKVLRKRTTFCDQRGCMIKHVCAVCHLPVRGRYLWCQGCMHGGHVEHITEWLSRSDQCPVGCGHKCQYL